MSQPPAPPVMNSSPRTKPRAERWLEAGLFASRWLMAPFYVGLIGALCGLMMIFFQEMFHGLPSIFSGHAHAEDAILLSLSLIDLSLAANLLLIVIFSGYENFVSKIDTAEHEDRPGWMGTVDFSGLKLKLIASIVAISGIALLKAFMQVGQDEPLNQPKLAWMVLLHLTFVISGVILATMDWIHSKAEAH